MGTPLFYEYTAHYDRGSADGKASCSAAALQVHGYSSEVKPSMAFTHVHEEPCGRCQGWDRACVSASKQPCGLWHPTCTLCPDNRIVRGGHPALTQTLAEVGAASG